MTGSVSLLAPGKVNLTLDVGPRRADGFHDLDSVVATFLPADELTIRIDAGRRGVRLTCAGNDALPTDETNLAHRAATRFLERFAPGMDIEITLDLTKHLPTEAGLGGGSSDAAAVLRGLNTLLPGRATPEDLTALAAALGSDVPLFLGAAGSVRMRGRGEIITRLFHPLPALHGVLVRPGVGVPTGSAYALLDALPDRAPGRATERLLAVIDGGGSVADIAAALGNDFERAVLPAFPEVAEAHHAVAGAGAVRALLCGSGSAIFGLARDPAHARALAKTLRGCFPWVERAEMTANA